MNAKLQVTVNEPLRKVRHVRQNQFEIFIE